MYDKDYLQEIKSLKIYAFILGPILCIFGYFCGTVGVCYLFAINLNWKQCLFVAVMLFVSHVYMVLDSYRKLKKKYEERK